MFTYLMNHWPHAFNLQIKEDDVGLRILAEKHFFPEIMQQ